MISSNLIDFFGDVRSANPKPFNVSSVAHRSVFRYPGGKTWFVPYFREWIKQYKSNEVVLVEPFAGGGIVSLTIAFERLAKQIVMCEIDEQVAAVWDVVLSAEREKLARMILDFHLTPDSLNEALAILPCDQVTVAFQTILRNRTSHGGIMAHGSGVMKNGESGKGILSRWYPKTLARRIRDISFINDLIEFRQENAFETLLKKQDKTDHLWFIDPPYTAGGKRAGSRLYKHSEIDHASLFDICSRLKGDFLLTYDVADEVIKMANEFGFEIVEVPMKNTHNAVMSELVIGRNLGPIRKMSC